MKKDLGSTLELYPTPVVVVGAMVNGKPTWTLVAHTGIVSHNSFLVSLAKPHFINQGVKESKVISVNVIDEPLLQKADYCGCNSGSKVDKSELFEYEVGETGAPMIKDAKVVMESMAGTIAPISINFSSRLLLKKTPLLITSEATKVPLPTTPKISPFCSQSLNALEIVLRLISK